MRLALFADVHANIDALSACLEHARAQGHDGLAFLGDLVGYNADPGPVLDLVAAEAGRGAIVVKGNHDAAAIEGASPHMDPVAAEAILWTRDRLSPAQRDFLAGLPLVAQREGATFVHASAAHPETWTYVSDAHRAEESLLAAGTPWVFCGHVHEQALYFAGAGRGASRFQPVPGTPIPVPSRRSWLAIAGSVGQPRDGNTAASYAIFDLDRASLTFFRVPYDCSAAARKVRRSGLPDRLARRLEQGR